MGKATLAAAAATAAEEQTVLASLLSLSGSVVPIPGTSLGLFLGDWAAIVELSLVGSVGALLVVATAFAAFRIRKSIWLAPRVQLALLWAICLAVPLAPVVLLSAVGPLRNRNTNFVLSSLGISGFFRMLELITGTGPKGFDASARNFMMYFSSPVEVAFDDDGHIAKVEAGVVAESAMSLLGHVAVLLACLSIGRHTNFTPFMGDADLFSMPFFGLPTAAPAMYLMTIQVYCMLTVSMQSGRTGLALMGVGTHVGMRQPLLLSGSVRDFWGRRWNLLIHRLMHRIFFVPVKPRFGPRAAAISAFVVSGLFHEYQWIVSNLHQADYTPFGPTKFFLIQFVLCAVEAMLQGSSLAAFCGRLPHAVRMIMITMACLPWGPFFLQGILGIFRDATKLFPNLVLMEA